MSLGSDRSGTLSTKAHPPHVSPLSRPGTRPGIRPVIRRASGWRTGTTAPAFLLPFGHRRWLVGRPVPARELGFPHGRLTSSAQTTPLDPDGVPTFRTPELRPGRVSSLPRGQRCSHGHRDVQQPPSAVFQRLAPTIPAQQPDPECQNDEASTRIQGHSPFRPSPHLWHLVGADTLGLSPELRTRPLPATHVRAGTGLEH